MMEEHQPVGGSTGIEQDRPVAVPVIALPLVADLFIGTATVGRLIRASAEELQTVRGMNRIRHAYREIIPGLEPYFVTGFHDDAKGVLATYELPTGGSTLHNVAHGLTTTVGMVGTIDAFILGALFSDLGIWVGLGSGAVILVGVIAFAIGFAILAVAGMRATVGNQARTKAIFPSPD